MNTRTAGLLAMSIALALVGCSEGAPRMMEDPASPADAGGPQLFRPDSGPEEEDDDDPMPPMDAGVRPPPPTDSGVPVDCPDEDLGSVMGEAVVNGSTDGLTNDSAPVGCYGGTGPDIGYTWTAPSAGRFTFDTQGTEWDTVLHVHRTSCVDDEMVCNDDSGGVQSTVHVELDEGEEVIVVVDGYGESSFGAFTLNITEGATDTESGDLCADGLDNDRDGRADCLDYDCGSLPECIEEGDECFDDVDNDGDGQTDCADWNCEELDECRETNCADGIDNEEDGRTDCADYDCYGEDVCIESECGDGVDNESDGTTDCDDYDCWDAEECTEHDAAECTDGLDNDEDGLSDCADWDCRDELPCMELECTDGMDNDEDGATDCDDYDCDENEACSEIACTDGMDNDEDALVDCADYDCNDDPACMENCTDGVDNNDDGLVDCTDYDCYGAESCAEEGLCTGGLDDDEDGRVDCDDSECRCDAACATDTCPGTDLGTALGMSLASGTNEGQCGMRRGECAGGGAEVSYTWTAPSTGMFTFDTIGSDYDTVLYLLDGATCSGTELACNDDESASGEFSLQSYVTVSLTEGQAITIVVDGYSVYSVGGFVLNIREGAAPTP